MTDGLEQLQQRTQLVIKCPITEHPPSQLLNRDIAVTIAAWHAIDSHNRICHKETRKGRLFQGVGSNHSFSFWPKVLRSFGCLNANQPRVNRQYKAIEATEANTTITVINKEYISIGAIDRYSVTQ